MDEPIEFSWRGVLTGWYFPMVGKIAVEGAYEGEILGWSEWNLEAPTFLRNRLTGKH